MSEGVLYLDIGSDISELKAKFDNYTDSRDCNGINECIKKAKELLDHELLNVQKTSLLYSIATGYLDLEKIQLQKITTIEREEIQENYIFYYRDALDCLEKIDEDTNGLYQQLYSNAGNAYDNIGRILEAMSLYDKASSKYGAFPMAYGNKGAASFKLARFVYDNNHAIILDHYAYHMLNNALEHRQYLNLHGNAADCFKHVKYELLKYYSKDILENSIDLGNNSFGKTKVEEKYRKWAIENTLFLNELNDAISDPIVAIDYIHLPSMIYNIRKNHSNFHFGLFNQIVQEYTSARYLFYEGTHEKRSVHLADRKVLIMEVEMNVTSHSDFCIRTSFKTLYSLFDRIAYFINEYYDLGIHIEDVSFKSIWKDKNERKKYSYKNTLVSYCENNHMLNALYWLSKDIYEDNYKRPTKPTSKGIYTLRNWLEHRYVVSTLDDDAENNDWIYFISTIDLCKTTLELLHLSREAIIYLSFSLHIEEENKKIKYLADGEKFDQFEPSALTDINK